MFRGNHPAKVDDKGRLKLPAAFKLQLDARFVTQFYITSTDGKCAEIWPLPEWERREAQLLEGGTLNPAVQKYLNLTSYYGQQVEMDSQGRLVLPQLLRGKAKLDADVAVRGKLNCLEVQNIEELEQTLATQAMSSDDWAQLAEIQSRRGSERDA